MGPLLRHIISVFKNHKGTQRSETEPFTYAPGKPAMCGTPFLE